MSTRGAFSFLVILVPMAMGLLSAFAVDDSFDAQLAYLRQQEISQVGRAPLVQAYEELIRKVGEDPRRAEAMLDVGGIFDSISIPAMNISPDPEKALEWYRKAVSAAVPGSHTWTEAQFRIASKIQWADTRKARRIVDEIIANTKENTLTLARLEETLQAINLRESNLDAAEQHTRRLLRWYDDLDRIPKDPLVLIELNSILDSVGSSMIEALKNAPLPSAERRERIRKLIDDHLSDQRLYAHGEAVLKDLQKELNVNPIRNNASRKASKVRRPAPKAVLSNSPPLEKQDSPPIAARGIQSGIVWGIISVTSVAIILVVVLILRRRQRDA